MLLQSLLSVTLALLLFTHSNAKILRNRALINRMLSHFQKDYDKNPNPQVSEHTTKSNVMILMRNVLCNHFPTIPCNMIMADESIRKLIMSALNLKPTYPTTTLASVTPASAVTSYNSVVGSEELSSFLQVHDPLYHPKKKYGNPKYSNEFQKTNKAKEISLSGFQIGRKNLRKFYPHKTKHDRSYGSEEKVAASVEASNRKNNYNVMPSPSESVWMIDYMKHGAPSVGFAYKSDDLIGKLMNAPNVMVDNSLVQHRKDVLHPDVYIKKNFVKKKEDLFDSDILEA